MSADTEGPAQWSARVGRGEAVRFGPSHESIVMFAITPVFVPLGIWGLFTGDSTLETVMSVVAIVVGGLGALRLLTLGRFLRTAALTVDRAGLHTRGTDLPWQQITEVRLRGMGQGAGLTIVCADRTVLTHTLRDAARASDWLGGELRRRGRPRGEGTS